MTSPRSFDADNLLRILVAILAARPIVFSFLGPEATNLTPFVIVFTLVAFSVIHSIRRYGGRSSLIFFLLTFAIGWSYETCSILTGFPFGHYHYSDLLGPKLWLVPVLIMPAYYAMGYLSWTMAHVLLDRFDDRFEKRHLFLVPIIASFIMVMWDLCIDPARATIEHAWVWHDGGAYFGVPIKNFAGWFLCVFTIFQCFALYYHKYGNSVATTSPFQRSFWTLPSYMYGAMNVSILITPFLEINTQVQALDNHSWWTGDLHATLALVSFFTMFFVSLLSLVRIYERKEV